MTNLTPDIIQWGAERGLHESNDLKPQLTKLIEELGEIAAGVARDDRTRIIDGVGDLLVVLINFGVVFAKRFHENDLIDQQRIKEDFLDLCLHAAWREIKDRKGVTQDGVFVKEEEST